MGHDKDTHSVKSGNSGETDSEAVRESAQAISQGLLSIESAAQAIDYFADNGFSADQTVALAHLITREAYRLQVEFEPIQKAIGEDLESVHKRMLKSLRDDAEDADSGGSLKAPPVSDATADDFRQPNVGVEYERFLPLLACAGSRDRFHALDVRRHQGVEAAVRYLERCNITPEHDQPAPVTLFEEGCRIDALHGLASSINDIACNIGLPQAGEAQIAPHELEHLQSLALAAKLLAGQLADRLHGEGGAA